MRPVNFLHSADWQIGKPFARIGDPQKNSVVRQERIHAIDRLGAAAREVEAAFVVVAGDLFDSTTPEKSTVSATCSAIGRIGVPVFAIPGNHDHGGPGSIWDQDFFRREHAALAPNFTVLLSPDPVELEQAVLLPCPLLRRQDAGDPTGWLRGSDLSAFGNKPRIVLAHGSTQQFVALDPADEDGPEGGANQIALERLPGADIDYIALGDWHGMKQVGAKAWYAGTPEFDRFAKGSDHSPGYVLVVTVHRGEEPKVTPICTSRLGWHAVEHFFTDDTDLAVLETRMEGLLGARVDQDLVRMELTGSLGFGAFSRLDGLLEMWRARLLRLTLTNSVRVAPSAEEMSALTSRAADPLISRVAVRLIEQMTAGGEAGEVARVALRELHARIS